MAVRVVLVDDHPDVRLVMTAMLSSDPRFDVVGEASDGAEGITVVEREQPDIVLLDLSMPVMDGLAALPHLLRVAPSSKVVVLSAFGTDRTVRAALDQGASAFVHKGSGLPETLVDTLVSVSGGVPGPA